MEAKAARIKDWVTNKLRDLEEQNEHLKAQNEIANEQMEALRKRLEQLQANRKSAGTATSARTSVVVAAAAETEVRAERSWLPGGSLKCRPSAAVREISWTILADGWLSRSV